MKKPKVICQNCGNHIEVDGLYARCKKCGHQTSPRDRFDENMHIKE